ncbi:Nn.00g028830.m01.CDS01 [Neocucurbitaria sp. VM-36]
MSMGTLHLMKLGEKVILGGLFVQLLFFAFFIVVAGVFHRRLVNDRPLKSRSSPMSLSNRARRHRQLIGSSSATQIRDSVSRADIAALPWKRHLYNLYFASTLIMIRSIFRVAEYIQGNAGYLLSHEVFLYIFDAVLMLLVLVSFNWSHPSQVTELYLKTQAKRMDIELQRTRDELLGQEARSDEIRKSGAGVRTGGWQPSRHS